MQHEIMWHEHRRGEKMWTANVGKIACTILPPGKYSVISYLWELIGPHPYIGRGGCSTLEEAKRSVAIRLDQCDKDAANMRENQTNLGRNEVGI